MGTSSVTRCDWVPWSFVTESPGVPSVYLWDVSKLSLQQFMNYTAQIFLTVVLVPVEVGFCSGKLGSLCLSVCLSKLYGSLPCDLTSLADLKRVVDSSVSSAFYLRLGWSNNFSALYMLNWKPKVLDDINLLEILAHSYIVPLTISVQSTSKFLLFFPWAQHGFPLSLIFTLSVPLLDLLSALLYSLIPRDMQLCSLLWKSLLIPVF